MEGRTIKKGNTKNGGQKTLLTSPHRKFSKKMSLYLVELEKNEKLTWQTTKKIDDK